MFVGVRPPSFATHLIFLTLFPPRTIMIACNVKQMSKEVSPFFSADDVAKIRNFSRTRSKVRLQPFCRIRIRSDLYDTSRNSMSSHRTCSTSWLAPWLPASTATSTSRRLFSACCWVGWRRCWKTAPASEETSTSCSSVPEAFQLVQTGNVCLIR